MVAITHLGATVLAILPAQYAVHERSVEGHSTLKGERLWYSFSS